MSNKKYAEMDLGKIVITPRPDNLERYDVLDLIARNGRSYLSLKLRNSAEVTDTESWLQLTENSYDTAVRLGVFEGTEEEWVASLSIASEEAARLAMEEIEKIREATGNAEKAIERITLLSDNRDKVIDGVWWRYNEVTKDYESTGIIAKGSDFIILGFYNSLYELMDEVPSPKQGDVYGVGTEAPYQIFIYDEDRGKWVDNGILKGDKGDNGKSAYYLYLEAGGVLDEEEFNTVLVSIENKVDKDEGKKLSSNDFTDLEKEKLAGVDNGANKYIHPDNETIRHVTDSEKTKWNSKAEANHNHDITYQVKGEYAFASHNHSGVYQPVGSYAASSHIHDTYQPKETGKGLSTNDFTSAFKTRVENAIVPTEIQAVNSLTGLPVNKYNLTYNYTAATPLSISFASTPAEGFECILSIKNNTSDHIIQQLPSGTNWQSDDDSIVLEKGKVREVSFRYILGTYIVRV